MLQFVLQGREPGQRLLRNWTKRTRTYGKQNFGENKLDNITVWNQWVCIRDFSAYCGLSRARYHNAWCRKTYSVTQRCS